jgi:hypothetical protein
MRYVLNWIPICLILFLSIGCTHSIAGNTEDMLTLGSALTKLSSAVESTVRYKNPPAGISDSELLVLATSHDPRILKPFSDYTLRVLNQNSHAIVLVCTKDGKYALLEDAGCSTKLDRHWWQEQPDKACDFSLDIASICTSPGL